jgi:hypothetical protein
MDIGGFDTQLLVFDPNAALSVLRETLRERWPDFIEEVDVEESETWHYFYCDLVSHGMIKDLGIIPEGDDNFFPLILRYHIPQQTISYDCTNQQRKQFNPFFPHLLFSFYNTQSDIL